MQESERIDAEGGVAVGEGEVGEGPSAMSKGAVVAGEGGIVVDGALLRPSAGEVVGSRFRPSPHSVREPVVELQTEDVSGRGTADEEPHEEKEQANNSRRGGGGGGSHGFSGV